MNWGLIMSVVFICFIFQFYIKLIDTPWRNLETEKIGIQNALDNKGVAIIPQVLSIEDTLKLRQIVISYKGNEYGSINSPYKRKDKIIPIALVRSFLRKIYKINPLFWDKTFPDYFIVESSLLISYPGSKSQNWHSDTVCIDKANNDAKLISFGIALDDIESDMGPLEVFPGSNNHHNTLLDWLWFMDDYIDEEWYSRLHGYKAEKCTCSMGSIVIWSSTVVHRGSANTSLKKRPVFYFSLMEPCKRRPTGATYSLTSLDNDKMLSLKDL